MRACYWLPFSPLHLHSHSHLQAKRMLRFALACCTASFLKFETKCFLENAYGAPGVMTRHSSSRGKPCTSLHKVCTSLHIYYALYLFEMRVSYWLSFSPSQGMFIRIRICRQIACECQGLHLHAAHASFLKFETQFMFP